MENKTFVRYQYTDDFEDEFREAGTLSSGETLAFFNNFPFEEQRKLWDDMPINSPFPTIHFTRNDGAYARIQMQEPTEYIVEILKKGQKFETYINTDFTEDPKKEAYATLKSFIEGSLDETIIWTDQNEFDSEENTIPEQDTGNTFSYQATWKDFLHFPEAFLIPVSLIVLIFAIFSGQGLLILVSIALCIIPGYVQIKLWRLRNQVDGTRIKIIPEEHAFLWEKNENRILVYRKDIKSCKIILHKTRSQTWVELRIQLKEGTGIELNSLLVDPMLLIRSLSLKYRVF